MEVQCPSHTMLLTENYGLWCEFLYVFGIDVFRVRTYNYRKCFVFYPTFLSHLLFFCLVLLHFLSYPFYAIGQFTCPFIPSNVVFS